MMANLDPEEGKFHDSNEGVFYYGFGRCAIKKYFEAAGVYWGRKPTASIVFKPRPSGEIRTFAMFLLTGVKRV